MVGANRPTRDLKDKSKRHLLGLPYRIQRVQRRVRPEQITSYAMRVHSNPDQMDIASELKFDRSAEPGDFELQFIPSHVRTYVRRLSIHNPKDLFKESLTRRTKYTLPVQAFIIATQIAQKRADILSDLLGSVKRERAEVILDSLGRSTIREGVRDSDIRNILLKLPNFDILGELALSANSLYRSGEDVLRLLIPHTDRLLQHYDYVDTGVQQLFNTNYINVLPTRVLPIDRQGVYNFGLPGSKTRFLASVPYNKDGLLQKIKELSGPVRLHAIGHLPKRLNNKIRYLSSGVRVDQEHISWEKIFSVLGGFALLDKDYNILNIPLIHDGESSNTVADGMTRNRIFNSRVLKSPRYISKDIASKSSGGYGNYEIDIYGDGRQFLSYKGRRNPVTSSEVSKGLFPHPLIRLWACEYRTEPLDPELRAELCGQALGSLPLIHY